MQICEDLNQPRGCVVIVDGKYPSVVLYILGICVVNSVTGLNVCCVSYLSDLRKNHICP